MANQDLTAELALDLSVAAAHVLGEAGAFGHRQPTALVARDPRASGEFLEAAVCAGLASAGVDVLRVGVIPTPAAAYLVNEYRTDLGVMLSASHNPMPDNGIKFFSRGGVKLPDDLEDAIEQRMGEPWARPVGDKVGRIRYTPQAVDTYVDHLVRSLRQQDTLKGLKIVLDTANGASYYTASAAFKAQSAEVVAIHDQPDGLNINERCGSTHPEKLQAKVVEVGADMGIIAILALALQEDHRLASNTVVATIMSNLGLILAMREYDIHVDQTKVGDRYVLESMNANGFSLGGEQSGHVIMSEFATTGDGVLTGLHLAARVARTGKTLKELASVMTRLPQALVNVRGVDKLRAGIDPDVNKAVADANQKLGDTGRVVLRVMVEAATQEEADQICAELAETVKSCLAL